MSALFRWPFFLVLLVPIQLVFSSRIALGPAVPDFIFLALLWGALRASPVQAIVLGFLLSPLVDSMAGLPIGLTALGWIPALWLGTRGREPNMPLSRLRWMIAATLGGLFAEAVIHFIETRTGGNFLTQWVQIGLPSLLYTLFFAFLRSLFPPFGAKE
ncbi:MAG: hypothetical protein OEM52_08595 [bacterium]|nr:hypothetical protein [bacterium]